MPERRTFVIESLIELYHATFWSAHTRLRLRIWFACAEEVAEVGVALPIWTLAEGGEKYSLWELSLLPYHKDGRGA